MQVSWIYLLTRYWKLLILLFRLTSPAMAYASSKALPRSADLMESFAKLSAYINEVCQEWDAADYDVIIGPCEEIFVVLFCFADIA